MEKNKTDNNTKDKNGFVIATEDGAQYFIMGKSRIKISEHFAQSGKSLGYLLEDVIQHAAVAC